MQFDDTAEIQNPVQVSNRNKSMEIMDELERDLMNVVDVVEGRDNLARRAIIMAQAGDMSEIRFTAIESLMSWLGDF